MAEMASSQPQIEQPVVDEYAPPEGASEFAMWVGVCVIAVMFAAGCIAYAMVRQHSSVRVDIPMVFWFSTGIINISSAVLYYAMLSSRVAHRTVMRRAIDVTAMLGFAFLVLQIPGLQQILAAHHDAIASGNGVYATMLILVALHGAHVLIGLIAMLLLARRVHAEKSQEHGESIRLISIYWHGLTVIWLGLFSLLVFAK